MQGEWTNEWESDLQKACASVYICEGTRSNRATTFLNSARNTCFCVVIKTNRTSPSTTTTTIPTQYRSTNYWHTVTSVAKNKDKKTINNFWAWKAIKTLGFWEWNFPDSLFILTSLVNVSNFPQKKNNTKTLSSFFTLFDQCRMSHYSNGT